LDSRQEENVHLVVTRQWIFRAVTVTNDDGQEEVRERSWVDHGLQNECPVEMMVYVHDTEEALGVGKAFVQTTVRCDVAALRAESYRAMNLLMHGAPHFYRRLSEAERELLENTLAAEVSKKGGLSANLDYTYIGQKLRMGFTSYHILMGDTAEVGYATVDVGPLEKLKEAAEDYQARGVANAGFNTADVLGMSKQVTAESGVAKAYKYEMTQATQLELLSMLTAISDTRVLKLACRRSGQPVEEAEAIYPQPRMMAPFDRLNAELELLEDGYPGKVVQQAKAQLLARLQIFDGMKPEEKAALVEMVLAAEEPEQDELSADLREVPSEAEAGEGQDEQGRRTITETD